MSNNHHFADVQHIARGVDGNYGVFAGGGADHALTVNNDEVSPDGPVIECTCQSCGAKLQYIPTWAEAVIISERSAPRDDATGVQWGWDQQEQTFYFPLKCGSCRNEIRTITLSPDEAINCIRRGINKGVVHQATIMQIQAQARASAAAHQRRGY